MLFYVSGYMVIKRGVVITGKEEWAMPSLKLLKRM